MLTLFFLDFFFFNYCKSPSANAEDLVWCLCLGQQGIWCACSWCPGWASQPLQSSRFTPRACCLQLLCNSSPSHWFSQRLKLCFHNHWCHIWAIPDLTESTSSPGRVWTHSPAAAESEKEHDHQRKNSSCSGLIPARGNCHAYNSNSYGLGTWDYNRSALQFQWLQHFDQASLALRLDLLSKSTLK